MTKNKDIAFGFGTDKWPGLAKVIEEAGEVTQVGGKIIMVGGSNTHWDPEPNNERLVDEMADQYAAITFMMKHAPQVNHMTGRFLERWQKKLAIFEGWHEEGEELP